MRSIFETNAMHSEIEKEGSLNAGSAVDLT
jgi:hypothetical protein